MNILAFNLCVDHKRPRAARLSQVADFIRVRNVDVLLVQEGLRCCWLYDTLRSLAKDLGFNYVARSSFGVPVFWEFRVGILTRYPILSTHAGNLEVPQSEFMDAIPLPWRRRAVGAVVQTPDLGQVALVSVHLSSSPGTPDDRQPARNEQFIKLIRFIGGMPKTPITVIGGDFNTSEDNQAFLPLIKCGYDIEGLNSDYICVTGAEIVKSESVWTDHSVSDHVGVLVDIER